MLNKLDCTNRIINQIEDINDKMLVAVALDTLLTIMDGAKLDRKAITNFYGSQVDELLQ